MNWEGIDIAALLKKEGVVTSPEFQAELDEAQIVFINYMIRWLRIKNPKNLAKVLSNFKPEEWLIGLPPEEILAGLTPQERSELSNQLKAEMEKITQDQN